MSLKYVFLLTVALAVVAAMPKKAEKAKHSKNAVQAQRAPVAAPLNETEICNGQQAGDSCGQDDCQPCGYCKDKMSYYFRCERNFPADPKDPITGVIVHESCDGDLWWNPDLKPSGVAVGGACDEWKNLSPEVQEYYNNDPDCVPEVCLWGQEEGDECSGNYWYYDPKTHGSFEDRDHLTCNGDLVWDSASETCRNAAHVEGCH